MKNNTFSLPYLDPYLAIYGDLTTRIIGIIGTFLFLFFYPYLLFTGLES
jgi:hypothetical protein